MPKKFSFLSLWPQPEEAEQGQSIVLIALTLVILIAFIGLAVDVGFIFARGAQLQAAVDAAALAGVTELSHGTRPDAFAAADRFFRTNGMPPDVVLTDEEPVTTLIGAVEYTVVGTWQIPLYFLRVLRIHDWLGVEQITLARKATASFFPLADIYASRRVEDGIVSTSNQGIFGPGICTSWGDPFSPINSRFETPRERNDSGTYSYQYRIFIPPDYPDNILRVELFDPDSVNQFRGADSSAPENFAYTITHTHGIEPPEQKMCASFKGQNKHWNPCLIQTGELDWTTIPTLTLSLDQINPYWIVRVDENRGTGIGPFNGDGSCSERNPGFYDPYYNTQTEFSLYYFFEKDDGTLARQDLAAYTGQTGDSRDRPGESTDLHWVSPGATGGSTIGEPAVAADFGSFEIDLTTSVPGILTDPGTGNRYIYLDVTSLSGASENGFEVWAGPPYYDLPSEVNTRNLWVLENPGRRVSGGATVFAVGNLPLNSNFENAIDVPLIYVGPEYAGAQINISLFDPDSEAHPPITFYFDSIPAEFDDPAADPNNTGLTVVAGDWYKTFGRTPEGRCFEVDKVNNNLYVCSNKWIDPPYTFTVPGVLDNCNWANPQADPDNCTPFYGGRLIARYDGGLFDTYGWQIRLEGLPFLVR